MIKDIKKYVRICSNCQRMRVHYHKSYEDFALILLNDVNFFYTVIMNFITNMFFTKNSYIEKISDVILIMMNKLIKHVTYIVIIKTLNTKDFINIF